MFKFFRSIRQSLFLQGKASRYLGYALGEIALIVIGILIALQIGDWNQARADAELEQRYIEQLILNIETDINRFEFQIEINDVRLHAVEILVKASKDPESVRDYPAMFLVAVSQMIAPAEEPLSSDTFDELRSTGHLKLLDEQLKKKLFGYYRDEGRMRQFQNIRHEVALEFRKSRTGILTDEQERWVLAELGVGLLPWKMEEALKKTYDVSSAVEAAARLQGNKSLIAWLPEIRKILTQVNSQHDGRIERAEDLLELLKAHQSSD